MTISVFFILYIILAAKSQEADSYQITITDPIRDGASINKICTTVKGTALIPTSDYIWILVHRKDLTGQWWPQGGSIVRENRFRIVVCLGQQQDIGMEFEIAVVSVNQAEHLVLQNYINTARQTGNWYPMSLPNVTSPAVFRTVIKAAHQN
jgi:hypothetical protein